MAITALRRHIVPGRRTVLRPELTVRLWGLDFANPVGVAAGFDKDGEVVDPLFALGFGFAEVGTVTPRPQPGNPRPRIFRLVEDEAMINRLGFNGRGLTEVLDRLSRRARPRAGVVGINVGPNRDSVDPVADCAGAVARAASMVDYLVINVSSPNTPGLRDWQRQEALTQLLEAALAARARAARRPPLLVKVAPDLNDEDIGRIADVVLSLGLDGLIATNTTIERPVSLKSAHRNETGGLSGRPLFERSTKVLRSFASLTAGKIPLIGVGGISSGADAYTKIRAGASLVQLYTAMVYQGPDLIVKILDDLAKHLRADRFAHVHDAVGADIPGFRVASGVGSISG